MSERNYNPSLAAQLTPAGRKALANIRELEPYDLLLYWIKERHAIHCKRYGLNPMYSFGKPEWTDLLATYHATTSSLPWGAGVCGYISPKEKQGLPWSNDPIFQNVYFCNAYRECDKVTGYLRDNYRKEYKNDPCVFLGTILLRMFNFIPTMKLLIGAGIPQQLDHSRPKQCHKALADMLKLLVPLRDAGQQMFGGAYIINFHMEGIRKVEAAARSLGMLIDDRGLLQDILGYCDNSENAMTDVAARLQQFDGFGNFYVYQYIGDLAYTYVLREAADWQTWSFCGPGTSRGLWRLRGETDPKKLQRIAKQPPNWFEQASELRTTVSRELKRLNYPSLHMRDLTNCLCEYDKYCRALGNERSIKRPYRGAF